MMQRNYLATKSILLGSQLSVQALWLCSSRF